MFKQGIKQTRKYITENKTPVSRDGLRESSEDFLH